jgi:peptidoglycan/LPS O-acetylase OafA/YrhL
MPELATASVRLAVRRCIVITVASIATAVIWVIGRVAHTSYIVQTPLGARELTLLPTVAATVIAGSAGWLVLAILERYWADRRQSWIALALSVLAVSVVAVFITPASIGTQTILAVQHCVAAAVLIPGLLRRHRPTDTLPGRDDPIE